MYGSEQTQKFDLIESITKLIRFSILKVPFDSLLITKTKIKFVAKLNSMVKNFEFLFGWMT